jgi:hypothetical protein
VCHTVGCHANRCHLVAVFIVLCMRFEVLTAVNVKITGVWDLMSRSVMGE